jgi:hypothetical protein
MSNRRRNIKLKETQWIIDVEEIMLRGQGPFGRKYLAEELLKMHPQIPIQQIRNEVSGAIQADRFINNRFKKSVKRGYWELNSAPY